MNENKIEIENVETKQNSESAQQKIVDQNTGFIVPVDIISLPSQGKIYPRESALYRCSELEVRHLTAPDEDILTSASLIRSGKMIDTLLSNCIKNKAVKVEEMISGDKNAIMVFLRVSGYGHSYDIKLDCPFCNENIKWSFDLSKLQMNVLEVDPIAEGTNRFKFTLPSKNFIEFKFLNSKEDKEINDTLENIKKKLGMVIDRNVTLRLKKQILSINNNEESSLINKFVDSMPVSDTRALRKYISKIEPDIIMKQDFTCSNCGKTEEVDVPITTEFFWPDTGV